MQRMTRDILALLEEQKRLEQVRYTLGDYELREPDYQQILRWAEAWGCSAEEVLERLEKSVFDDWDSEPVRQIMFTVVDGRIHSLVWDCDQFSAEGWTWHEGLNIETLAFSSANLLSCLPINLPASLQTLYCRIIGLDMLDLSTIPNLTRLLCNGNELPQIDLDPMLDHCSSNQLTEFDLSPVPNLTVLLCVYNQLTALDLSPVPNLTWLNCSCNQLTDLDLSAVPNLTYLNFMNNQLTALDLTPIPKLMKLRCDGNQLTDLDLSPVPNLTKLNCWYNQLTDLDLSPVPNLTKLRCWNNPLTKLDIRPLTKLQSLWVDRKTRLIGTPPPGCEVKY